jgi:hypothetical protein
VVYMSELTIVHSVEGGFGNFFGLEGVGDDGREPVLYILARVG